MPLKYQFLYSKVPMLSVIEGTIGIGATGAVSSSSGAGVASITRLGTGLYQIICEDGFSSFESACFLSEGPKVGSAVTAGSFVTGTLYRIVTLGTTNFAAVGLTAGLTAAIGQSFVATGVGSGTGTVQAVSFSNSDIIEMPSGPSTMLQNSLSGQGSVILFQTYALSAAAFTATTASSTTLSVISSFAGLQVGQAISGAGIPLGTVISAVGASTITISAAATASASAVPMYASPAKLLADPASGSFIRFQLYFRNSSAIF